MQTIVRATVDCWHAMPPVMSIPVACVHLCNKTWEGREWCEEPPLVNASSLGPLGLQYFCDRVRERTFQKSVKAKILGPVVGAAAAAPPPPKEVTILRKS